MEQQRERLGSRLGFILLSAGCAIGCGNVWKFPWMCGQYGGGAFVLIYIVFLILLGVPVMTMEFSLGRAAQTSPVRMYRTLAPGRKAWSWQGAASLTGNVVLMMFYTSVTGWILYYFFRFITGSMDGLTAEAVDRVFTDMQANPAVMTGCMAAVVLLGFVILSFGVQGGLERVTKYMMLALLGLMLVLAVHSCTLPGASEGLRFYLVPHLEQIDGSVIVGAMNQAFFTLSLGIGSMAIFGSYIGKERALMGESFNIIALDTSVALVAGLIIFPACFTFGIEPGAGPGLLFSAMANVFAGMSGGRFWGALFFLFMFFAAMSTVLTVFENILACVRELTGWSRRKACLICCAAVLLLSLPCALGFNLLSGFRPFSGNSTFLDLEDFIVSNCLLPLGSLSVVLFCTRKSGFGWNRFTEEANTGRGPRVKVWMRGYMTYVLPLIILAVFFIGLADFF